MSCSREERKFKIGGGGWIRKRLAVGEGTSNKKKKNKLRDLVD